ncbi:MAG: MBL fold metallo-hydrolase [Chlamydiota bacterium]
MPGFFPIASGSKGNASLLVSEETCLLIDAGVSAKRITQVLASLGKTLAEVEGVIVTHEHHDHISGLTTLNKKWGIPIFSNVATAKGIYESLGFIPKCKIFSTGEPFCYKDIEIDPFTISHDTADPVALLIQTCDKRLGICTDLGFVSSLVEKKLRFCDVLYLEANHDPQLVEQSKRPSLYKVRVLGNQGHLSNAACGKLLADVHHPGLEAVYLAHLSSECNTGDLAMKTVENLLGEKKRDLSLFIAHQDRASSPFSFSRAEQMNGSSSRSPAQQTVESLVDC